MDTPKKHAIFHLPYHMDNSAIKFARLLMKEGFSIFGNASFIHRAYNEGGIVYKISKDDSRRADTLITIGDYSIHEREYHCFGTSNSIDIDVSSLENEIQALWLVMIASRLEVRSIGETVSREKVDDYATIKPFLEALKAHKTAVAIRASELARINDRIKETTADVGEAFKSSILHSPFIDRLVQLAAEKPASIYAQIVAKLDTVPE